MNNKTELTNKDFFFCYNIPMSIHLIGKGFKYMTYAYHPSTNKLFYMFHKTEELNAEIKKYSLRGGE